MYYKLPPCNLCLSRDICPLRSTRNLARGGCVHAQKCSSGVRCFLAFRGALWPDCTADGGAGRTSHRPELDSAKLVCSECDSVRFLYLANYATDPMFLDFHRRCNGGHRYYSDVAELGH